MWFVARILSFVKSQCTFNWRLDELLFGGLEFHWTQMCLSAEVTCSTVTSGLCDWWLGSSGLLLMAVTLSLSATCLFSNLPFVSYIPSAVAGIYLTVNTYFFLGCLIFLLMRYLLSIMMFLYSEISCFRSSYKSFIDGTERRSQWSL